MIYFMNWGESVSLKDDNNDKARRMGEMKWNP